MHWLICRSRKDSKDEHNYIVMPDGVAGLIECCLILLLCSNRLLSDYEYIYQCRKFAVPVKLVIVDKRKPSPLRGRRSSLPDLSMPSAAPPNVSKCVSQKEANALLDSYHAKEEMFRSFLKSKQNQVSCLLIYYYYAVCTCASSTFVRTSTMQAKVFFHCCVVSLYPPHMELSSYAYDFTLIVLLGATYR